MVRLHPSLRTRILLAFGMSFSLFLGAIGYSIYQVRALGSDIELVNRGYLPLAKLAARVESHQDRIDLDVARLQRETLRPLAAFRSNTALHASQLTPTIALGLETARSALAAARQPQDLQDLGNIVDQWSRLQRLQASYEDVVKLWVEQADRLDPDEDQARQADVLRRQKELQAAVKQLVALLDSRIRSVNERIARAQARADAVGGTLAGLSLAFGLAMLGWTLITLRPIGRLTTEVQRVGAGDYTGHIEVRGSDEIGVLAREFNAMAVRVAERDRRLKERAAELNRLSHYLRSVLDTIRLGILVVEGDNVTMMNPAARDLWNVESRLPDFLASLPAGRHAALHRGDRRQDVEVVPFGTAGRLVVGEDVTERLQDQDRLERSGRLALIGQMLAQICHEIRNPLNAMSLNAELLGEEIGQLDSAHATEAPDLLATIVQEILRLEGVTEHYLDLARRPLPTFDAEDPAQVVRSVCHLEEAAFLRAGVTLRTDVPDALPPVPMDGNQIRRAILNVLNNALQSGASTVTVRVGVTEEGLEVQVVDDGRGMDEETVQKAFEPFFSTRSKGTGLGLAIARQVLEDHDGQILCTSAPGAGTTFTLRLPKRPALPPGSA